MKLPSVLFFVLAGIFESEAFSPRVKHPHFSRRCQVTCSSEKDESSPPPPPQATIQVPPKWSRLEGSAWKLTLNLVGFNDRDRSEVDPVSVTTRVQLLPPEKDGLSPVLVFGERESKYITKGFVWSTGLGLDDNSRDGAYYLRFNVAGRNLEPVVPDGSLYVNARIERAQDGALKLEDGLVTFKRPQKASFLWMSYDGLLAEFKVVGDCSLVPIADP
mmetsp:Transcript_26186/g.58668  ORF Transcript_26186/g.58668 Transcript_26186/m.58668 type:complete len:217 (+) Transcript_26186:183-833(+)|eukprot:CAMPEP_0172621766 /NCGR_PEP_ID=MMETSP1068-20121228/115114_1 /TAXON_ID=35684 /ORGANISM="Pseudopedinella elastica, Strain CCMP716" /LENGTH=216 /DNA_ID=CAMNT_0013429659 /DNA_START=154 /DNA_END=804 /DNA_ORIENTATION=+